MSFSLLLFSPLCQAEDRQRRRRLVSAEAAGRRQLRLRVDPGGPGRLARDHRRGDAGPLRQGHGPGVHRGLPTALLEGQRPGPVDTLAQLG